MADDKKTTLTIAVFALFASTIPAANWMIQNIGTVCTNSGPCLIPVGFGLFAPSGVLMIGAALVLRDWLQELAGWKASFAAVCAGAILSASFSPAALVVASSVSFLVAETADLLVYSKLRKTNKPLAVMASQAVGAAIDSILFVFIAFGSFDFAAGTTLAKLYAGGLVAGLMVLHMLSKRKVA